MFVIENAVGKMGYFEFEFVVFIAYSDGVRAEIAVSLTVDHQRADGRARLGAADKCFALLGSVYCPACFELQYCAVFEMDRARARILAVEFIGKKLFN